MTKIYYTIIAFFIMMGSTLALFDIFPMEITQPHHDLMIICIGLIIGSLSFFYMDEYKLFQSKIDQN